MTLHTHTCAGARRKAASAAVLVHNKKFAFDSQGEGGFLLQRYRLSWRLFSLHYQKRREKKRRRRRKRGTFTASGNDQPRGPFSF